MAEAQNHKPQSERKFDLEDRTLRFAQRCKYLIKKLPKNIVNIEYGKQLARASGSQAANYIEANEATSKKEFIYRMRVCRKESKECCLWLNLLDLDDAKLKDLTTERDLLIKEAEELRRIFNAIIEKSI